jgi:hypothetical protein
MSWDSSVDIVTVYGLNGWGSISGVARDFSLLNCLDQLWGSSSLLSNGYWGTVAGA